MSLPRLTSVRAILRYPATLKSGTGVDVTQSSGTVTFSINIPDLTTDAAPTTDDYLVSYDRTGLAHRKITIADVQAINGSAAPRSTSVNYTITTADANRTLFLKGTSMGTVTFGAATGFANNHDNNIINQSSRRWSVVVNGVQTRWLWPDQAMRVSNNSASSWGISDPGLWRGVSAINTSSIGSSVVQQFYVDATLGSDTNDGLTTGVGACLKIQTAMDLARFHTVVPTTVNLASGTHTPPTGQSDVVNISGPAHGHQSNIISITGDTTGSTTTRQNFILQCSTGTCLNSEDYATIIAKGMFLKSTGANAVLALSNQNAILDLTDVDVGTASVQMAARLGATINLNRSGGDFAMVIRGSPAVHLQSQQGGIVSLGTMPFSVPTALSFSVWASTTDGGIIWNGSASYAGAGSASGSVGQRYLSSANGIITSNGTLFPGTVNGATLTGGQFS